MKASNTNLIGNIKADALYKYCVSLQVKSIENEIERNSLSKKIEELNETIKDLENSSEKDEIIHLKESKSHLQTELEELKDHFRRMEEHANLMAKLKTEAEINSIKLHRQSASLKRIKNSFSFKITKPIRWFEKQLLKNDNQNIVSETKIVEEPIRSEPAPTGNDIDVIFLNGCLEGESKRYRIYNIIEGLNKLGYKSEVMDASQGRNIYEKNLKPKVVVCFRAPYDHRHSVSELIEYCASNKIPLVYDIDDYVFEPDIISSIAGVKVLPPEQIENYEWSVRAYRSLLLSSDLVTSSTPFLTDKISNLGKKSFTIINSINDAQIQKANDLLAAKTDKKKDAKFIVGYYSGSRTHFVDFEECALGLQQAMRQNKNIHFRLAGHLDLDSSWDEFSDRVERQGYMRPLDMLASQSECDITLAPLERDNDFCHGKSELKFFESALVEVPTIASPTHTFVRAIDDGKTGILATNMDEWRDAILMLSRSPQKVSEIGKAARKAVLEKYTSREAALQALYAYGLEIAPNPSHQKSPTPMKIAWIVPGLIIGGGGHRNILRAAYHLESFGHEVTLYFSDTNMESGELRRAVRQHFYPFAGPVHRFEGKIEPVDIMMATHWSTVELAESVRDKVGEILYFVQDFEPAFYPMGSEYIMAENTYRKNLYAVCSGPWCERLLKADYGMEADHFRFPVDKEIYFPRPHIKPQKRILYFAKPDMPRRCFLIGVSALREFHKLHPEYEIMFYGSEAAKAHPLDFPVTFCGVLPTIHDLADLYASSSVGIVFSTTNPSLVPYEMMACGLPVVDLGRPGNEVNYDDRFDIALLADPQPAKMAEQIAEMIENTDELNARREKGIAFASSFPTEEEMAQKVEQLIINRWKSSKSKTVARPKRATVKKA